MNEPLLRQLLAQLPIPALRYFEQVGSTNDEALRWADDGAPDGALVVADAQTAGRGRMERRWVTHPGSALAFSLILRPDAAEAGRLGLFSPLCALAVAQALEESCGLHPQIKWPNDVLLDGRKACGILLDAAWDGSRPAVMVVGIGVNVLRGAVPETGLLFPATSVEHALGRAVAREELLRDILAAFFGWRPRLGSEMFLRFWQTRLAYQGEPVVVEQPAAEPVTGVVMGVGAGGELRLRLASGEEFCVNAGDVRLRPAANQPNAHLGES